MTKVEQIIKNVFTYCVKHAKEASQFDSFLKDLLQFTLISNGVKTVNNMFEAGTKTVKEYFKSEELILTDLNPLLMQQLLPLYLE